MRALRVANGTSALVKQPEPVAGGEALVRVTLSGICNTDLELARGYAGFRGTLGHEFVGIVEDGAGELAAGTRVVGEINAGCGTCPPCTSGDSRHCPTRTVLGIVGRDGAHADLLRLPARNLLAVPDGVTDPQAVFVEPFAAALGILERCPIAPGERVAIIGDGKLGLLCAMALAPLAPLLIGKHAAKVAIAAATGVETTIDADDARRRGKFDVVVEASGGASGFALALDLLRPQGRLVLKSTFHGATPVDAARIVVDEITVIGSRCGRFAPALDQLARGGVPVQRLVTDVMSLDRGEAAMQRAAMPGVLKLLLSTAMIALVLLLGRTAHADTLSHDRLRAHVAALDLATIDRDDPHASRLAFCLTALVPGWGTLRLERHVFGEVRPAGIVGDWIAGGALPLGLAIGALASDGRTRRILGWTAVGLYASTRIAILTIGNLHISAYNAAIDQRLSTSNVGFAVDARW